jgi:DNA-binding response OmpR family regulator
MTNLSNSIKVLLVEDNERLREELVNLLCQEGLVADGVGDGAELNERLKVDQPHVLILDLNLPFEDGISIATRVRVAFPEIRIVMLTGRVNGVDRAQGYEAGADIYLTKPTRPVELLAVIRNLHRRYKGDAGEEARWSLDSSKFMMMSSHGQTIKLTEAEVSLLYAMAISGRHLDHLELMSLFNQDLSDEKSCKSRLEVLISRLRSKLRTQGSGPLDIQVLRGRGYRLTFALACLGVAPPELVRSADRDDD